MSKPIIIDCDPGIDDAMAILMAVTSPDLDVKLITTVAGNQTVDKTTRNTLDLLSFIGDETIEVAKGAAAPLIKPLVLAEKIHGDSGLGNVDMNVPGRELSTEPAVEAMRKVLENSIEKITLIAVGPLTNVALLIKTYPHLTEKIGQLSIMGGSLRGGNITPAAEFNFFVDPEAAKIVLESGVPVTLFGLHVTQKVPLYKEDIERIRDTGNETGRLVASMLDYYFQEGRVEGLHDPCAVASLLDPGLFQFSRFHVQVETKGEYTSGMTVMDQRRFSRTRANVYVAMDVNREGLISQLENSIRKLK
ncbi:nucleoside hydrolase [Salipaludibacillus aurantiacus]|uniref:Pyrimidine-specific ribonucleoside hydrolase n=1 Tax=Salipaludibacillus aurantiacus TaxID=1601833 RepID=A0A1H9SBN9_9BACI|nr:nucleoside hydrolase [Salipaludibacillus aurantiacus]SER82424.1 pyrimidine-specific ribonucleoside hydrolase [Salipaludibacillus aurantiacus]